MGEVSLEESQLLGLGVWVVAVPIAQGQCVLTPKPALNLELFRVKNTCAYSVNTTCVEVGYFEGVEVRASSVVGLGVQANAWRLAQEVFAALAASLENAIFENRECDTCGSF